MRRRQVTCRCAAYDFPHRFGGGKCDGYQIALSKCGGEYCMACPAWLGSDGGCDVVKGTESPSKCEYVIEFCNYNEVKI